MNTLQALLFIIANDSFRNDSFYNLAMFVLDHFCEMDQFSLRSFAQQSYSSQNTINSFLKFLGFSSYADFKKYLDGAKKVRLLQMKERYAKTDFEKIKKDIQYFSPKSDIEKIYDEAKLMARDIHEAGRMVILGASYPLSLCVNFQEDMLIMGKHIILQQTSRNAAADLHRLKPDDFVFLITFSGTYLTIDAERKKLLSDVENLSLMTFEKSELPELNLNHLIRLSFDDPAEEYNHCLMSFMELLKKIYHDLYFDNL